jgi:hypothetical protein
MIAIDQKEFNQKIDEISGRIKARPRGILNWVERYRPVYLTPERPQMDTRPLHIKEWLQHFDRFKCAIIIAPPGHGKSWALQDTVIRRICSDRNTRGIWASKTKSEAMKVTGAIRDELQSNRAILTDYGRFQSSRWGTERFTVRRSLSGAHAKEATLQATGLDGQIEGMRLQFAALDDIIDISSLTSEAYRRHAISWLQNTLFPRLDPGATIWIIGSRWHYSDAYSYLMSLRRRFPPESIIQVQAVKDWSAQDVLAPEMCPWDYLMDQRDSIGPDGFNLRYQQMAADRANAPMPEIKPISLNEIIEKGRWLRFVGADWNASEKEKSHLSALVFVDLLPDLTMVVSACFSSHRQRGYREWARECIEKASANEGTMSGFPTPTLIASESIGFQSAVSRELQESDPHRGFLGIPIKEVGSSVKGEDRMSKYHRIVGGISPWLTVGKLRYYTDGVGIQDIIFDLMGYPDVMYDDRLDALERAIKEAVDRIRREKPGPKRVIVSR